MKAEDLLSIAILVITGAAGIWLNGLLSALRELSPARIRKLDPKRKPLAERAERWLARREAHRIVIRLLNLFSLAVLATTVHGLVRHWYTEHDLLLLVGVGAVVTVLYVLISEVLGHVPTVTGQWRLLSLSMPALELAGFLLQPLIRPVLYVQEHAHPWGAREDDGDDIETTEDEIISLVEQDAQETAPEQDLEDDERRMIRRIFDLDETLVREIMSPRVDIYALPVGATVEDARMFIRDCGHSRIPVYRETVDQIIGIILAKDLLESATLDPQSTLDKVMHPAWFVPETKVVKDLLAEMRHTRNQIAVVIDEYGGVAGLVTVEDILEEIVGEIEDEYDEPEPEKTLKVADDGSLELEGRTPIHEINELLHLAISEEENYDTIGGFVSTQLGRIPRTGEQLTFEGLEVEVLEADERKVSRLRLRTAAQLAPPAED